MWPDGSADDLLSLEIRVGIGFTRVVMKLWSIKKQIGLKV